MFEDPEDELPHLGLRPRCPRPSVMETQCRFWCIQGGRIRRKEPYEALFGGYPIAGVLWDEQLRGHPQAPLPSPPPSPRETASPRRLGAPPAGSRLALGGGSAGRDPELVKTVPRLYGLVAAGVALNHVTELGDSVIFLAKFN